MMPQRLVVDAFCEMSSEITWNEVREEYDWASVGDRITRSFVAAGLSFKTLLHLLDLDISSPDYWDKRKALDPVRTTNTIASFIGVPAVWLLTGEGKNPLAAQDRKTAIQKSIEDVSDSTVVQGNSGTVVINHGMPVDVCKTELMRVCSTLPIKQQVELLAFAYKLEEAKEK